MVDPIQQGQSDETKHGELDGRSRAVRGKKQVPEVRIDEGVSLQSSDHMVLGLVFERVEASDDPICTEDTDPLSDVVDRLF